MEAPEDACQSDFANPKLFKGWNHRVMRHEFNRPDGSTEVYYAIHEVYYNEIEVGSIPASWTTEPVSVNGDDIESIKWQLEMMLEALSKPPLDYHAKPNPTEDKP